MEHRLSASEVARAQEVLDHLVVLKQEGRAAAFSATLAGERLLVLGEPFPDGTIKPIAVLYDEVMHSYLVPDQVSRPILEIHKNDVIIPKPYPKPFQG